MAETWESADLADAPPINVAPLRDRGTLAGQALANFEPSRLEVVGVGHTYAAGSPWAQPALSDVNLAIEPHEGVLVVGGNGSGKSTLAWIMAGVLRPSRGQCLLDGQPVSGQVGSVGLAFQHARLQLQRTTVGSDILVPRVQQMTQPYPLPSKPLA